MARPAPVASLRAALRAAVLLLHVAAAGRVAAQLPPGDAGPSGTVVEVLPAPPYSYLRLRTAQGERWAAVPQTDVAPGEEVSIAGAMRMDGFESLTLKRRWDTVYFGTLVRAAPRAPPAPPPAPAAEPPDQALADARDVRVELKDGPARPRNLQRVWGSAPADVWAVGYHCEILHWDGRVWTVVSGGGPQRRTALLCGDEGGPPDMFAGVGGSSSTDVWVVGGYKRGQTILHWDGARWARVQGDGEWMLSAVWAASAREAWAFGGHGTILRWDGSRWSRVPGTEAGWSVVAAWGSSPADVWAVGSDVDHGYRRPPRALLLHWDGVRWAPVPVAVEAEALTAVWGTSARDVWVSAGSVRLRWDGRRWEKAAPPPVEGAWRGAADDVWAIEGGAKLLHWDGARWSGDAPVESLRVQVRREPARPLAGLAPTVGARSDTFVFTGADAGFHEVPAEVTIPYDPDRAGPAPMVYCWSPGGDAPVVDRPGGRARFSGEGKFVGTGMARADPGARRLTFSTTLLTECLVAGISEDKERAYAERQRASVRRALGITPDEEAAARARGARECERRSAAAAPRGEAVPLASLLAVRPLATVLPGPQDVGRPAAGPSRRSDERPRTAFAPGVRAFELPWRIPPESADERLVERVEVVRDRCVDEASEPQETSELASAILVPFLRLRTVETAAALRRADAARYLDGFGDELHPVSDHVLRARIAVAVEARGPFHDVLTELQPEGGLWITREIVHRLVLSRAAFAGGRFAAGARDPATVAAVLDGLWYGGRTGEALEAVAERTTPRFVLRDHLVRTWTPERGRIVRHPDGRIERVREPGQALRVLVRVAVDRSDGAAFLLPLVVDEQGRRQDGPPAAIELGSGVEYR